MVKSDTYPFWINQIQNLDSIIENEMTVRKREEETKNEEIEPSKNDFNGNENLYSPPIYEVTSMELLKSRIRDK